MSNNKISLSAIRAARESMTSGKYGVEPKFRLHAPVLIEINGQQYQVATMADDTLAADPTHPHIETQPWRNALGFAVMANHIGTLLEIAEAALDSRTPVTDEESARQQYQAVKRLDAALAKVMR